MHIEGIHHVSIMMKDAIDNKNTYTNDLGLRFVKKTVNQDSPDMYHLFYADQQAQYGTDITFFELPSIGSTHRGTNAISRTYLRVPSIESLKFFKTHLSNLGYQSILLNHRYNEEILDFDDHQGTQLSLIVDETIAKQSPAGSASVEQSLAPYRLGPVEIRVQYQQAIIEFFKNLNFEIVESFETPERTVQMKIGNDSIYIIEDKENLPEKPGSGSIHHVAFTVEDESVIQQLIEHFDNQSIPHSGLVNRHYFKSLYVKAPNNIQLEFATKGPGFTIDEPLESLGERLSLPPFLEDRRDFIEGYLKEI